MLKGQLKLKNEKELIEHYIYFKRVIKNVLRSLPATYHDECYSQALVIMVEASRKWKPDKGTTFKSYVSESIRYGIIDFLRAETHFDRSSRTTKIAETFVDIESAYETDSKVELFNDIALLSTLPKSWRIALVMDLKDAMVVLGVSSNRIYQLRLKARKKLGIADKALIDDAKNPLTARENELMLLVAQGESNASAGKKMFITEETVKTYISRIIEKLGAKNRTHALYILYNKNYWKI